jgi:hypothetical protein
MLHGRAEIEKQDYRKKSAFFKILPTPKAMLRLSPTYLRCDLTFNLDDYGKKAGITLAIRGQRMQANRRFRRSLEWPG